MQNVSYIQEAIDSPTMFCEKGDRAEISDEASQAGISFPLGIPDSFGEAQSPEKRITRQMLNAFGYLGSSINLFGCCGGLYGISSGTLGGEGYSKGAVIRKRVGLIVRSAVSLHGGNTYSPGDSLEKVDGDIWAYCDGIDSNLNKPNKPVFEFDAE